MLAKHAESLPMRERELKRRAVSQPPPPNPSLPMRERDLKLGVSPFA